MEFALIKSGKNGKVEIRNRLDGDEVQEIVAEFGDSFPDGD